MKKQKLHLVKPVPANAAREAPDTHAHRHSHGSDPVGRTGGGPHPHSHPQDSSHGHARDHEASHATGPHSDDDEAMLALVLRTFRENEQLKAAYAALLKDTSHALMSCLEEKDAYTYGHSMRVMEYSLLLGRGLGLPDRQLKNLELAAMFHDLGKMGVPDCVLLKPDRLTSEEQLIIEQHPVASARILSHIHPFYALVAPVKHHHERVDGLGYPSRLGGHQIPELARMILVADTFDAMTSTRPYRKALPIATAYEELERCAGTQFEPTFVQVFLREHQRLYRHVQSAKRGLKKAA